MSYTHVREGHSDLANEIADEVCEILNRIQAETIAQRLAQIEEGTAPAYPWQYSLIDLAYVSLCANSMDRVTVERRDPTGKPCPQCREVHPLAS